MRHRARRAHSLESTREPFADPSRTRLTYVMLFRVGLVTFLLAAALAAEIGAPADAPPSPAVSALFDLIVATYGLTIAFALLLTRIRRTKVLELVQIGSDLFLTTLLVHLTGSAESAFAFMYILVVLGASFLQGRNARWVVGLAIGLYVGDGLLQSPLPLRTLLRTLAVNTIAFGAAGALATRLAQELRRAGEHIASQGAILRDLATLHEDVIRGLSSGLVTIGHDGRVMTFNHAAAEIIGQPEAATLGKPLATVMPELAKLQASLGERILRRGEVTQEVVRANGSREERQLGVSLSPLVDAGGTAIGRIINFQDLTELRQMEAAVKRAEQLAAVGRLAAGIAHEIRNPLAAISGSIELLAQSLDHQRSEDRELMSIVLREVERLNGLITQLLEFARPRTLELARVDLGSLLGEIVRVFAHDKRLGEAAVELDAPSLFIDADPEKLRQVMWNLLRNAAEAAPGQPIAVAVAAEPRVVRLTVRDRGAGIPAEHRERLFEPFFSTKEGGTGLGLATVHRIVEEHGGSIEIECPPSGGTLVVVRLPREARPAASP